MAIASDTGFGVHFARFFLEEADQDHMVVVVEQGVTILTLWYGCVCLLLYRRRSVLYIDLFFLSCVQGKLTFLI